MNTKNKKIQKAFEYECADGQIRSFNYFFFSELFQVMDLLNQINNVIPGLNFVNNLPENNSGYPAKAVEDLFVIMLSEKHCDKPLDRKQIEKGEKLNALDLIELLKIAYKMAALERLAKAADILGIYKADQLPPGMIPANTEENTEPEEKE